MRQRVIRGWFIIICVLVVVFRTAAIVGAAEDPVGESSEELTAEPNPTSYPNTSSLQTGAWQVIEGKKYYLLPGTWEKAKGWQNIGNKRYYFLPETNEMVKGLQNIEGNRYYFSPKTGEMLHGRQKIENMPYFFDNKGVLYTSGWVTGMNKKKYYCESNGILASGWKKIDGQKYYFSPKNNQMAIGLRKIQKYYYIFHENGCLAQSDSVTIVKAGGRIYCAGPNGKASSGWHIKSNKLYYVSKNGKVKTSTTYQGITFTKTGAAKSNVNSKLKIEVLRILNSITNSKMSKREKLQKCWAYVTKGKLRYASKYPNLSLSNWQKTTAYNMLSTRTGNCYSYACAFAALASEIGYQPYLVCGRVRGSRDRAADGFTRHAWVRINRKYYDPEAQYAGWRRGIYGNRRYPTTHKIQKVVAYNK